MTLSIEVLPAPFGPMMARISPPAMSKDTSVNALTPPNDNDTLSTERSALRAPPISPLPVGERSDRACAIRVRGGDPFIGPQPPHPECARAARPFRPPPDGGR